MSHSDLRDKTDKFKIPRRLDDNNPYARSKTADGALQTSSPTHRTRSSSIPGPFDNLAISSSSIALNATSPRPDEEEQRLRRMGERSRNFAQILKDMLKDEDQKQKEKEEGTPGELRKAKKREGLFFSSSTTKILTKKKGKNEGSENNNNKTPTKSTRKENGSHENILIEGGGKENTNNDSDRDNDNSVLAESAPWLVSSPGTEDDPVTLFKSTLTEKANKLAIQVTSVQSRLLTFDIDQSVPEQLEREAINAANLALLTLKEIVNMSQNPPAVLEGQYSKEEWFGLPLPSFFLPPLLMFDALPISREHQQKFGLVSAAALECKSAVQALLKAGRIGLEGYTATSTPNFASRYLDANPFIVSALFLICVCV